MATIHRNEQDEFPAFAWPGGYPIYYLFADGGICCPACANRENGSEAEFRPDELNLANINRDDAQWQLIACDVHWEGAPIQCSHCNAEIESAYGDPDNEAE